ncbi:solute carrier family 22 [Nesidiocoris tenuis]|uniref:Solute carrier family 22 n=1 Tax=Nesidiocoris tenuis TaxID=355587 RepID=A0ABN7ABN7_9HEMI|nr:solute carrier family 22 [Nesidiocoris tenuis]
MEVDDILDETGQFGLYQIIFFVLLFLIDVQTSIFPMSFVFTAAELKYRCLIPQCEDPENATYYDSSLTAFLPSDLNGQPSSCLRYAHLDQNGTGSCSLDEFLTNSTERCSQLVFDTARTSIASEFDLLCDDNRWKLSAVGTSNNIGQFAGYLTFGVLSDKYGRKYTLIGALLSSTLFGVLRSYAPNFTWFLIFEFFDAFVSTGVFAATYILAMEILGPDQRLIGGAMLQCFYAVGQTLLGVVSWTVLSWRSLLRILYLPGLVFIAYIWLIPESLRWLIVHKRFDEAIKVLEKIGKTNRKPLSESTKHKLLVLKSKVHEGRGHEEAHKMLASTMSMGKEEEKHPILTSLKSKIIFTRVIVCSFCWMANIFVYAGLSLNSVFISGHQHVNFILTSLVEIPANILMYPLLNRCGRRGAQLGTLFLSGFSLLAFALIPSGLGIVQLVLYLFGKVMITISFAVLYVYFSELFPTNARNTLMATCALISRIGSISAPLSRLLSPYIDPVIVFGVFSILGGLSALLLPETRYSGLPDTLLDAENIGKKESEYRRPSMVEKESPI